MKKQNLLTNLIQSGNNKFFDNINIFKKHKSLDKLVEYILESFEFNLYGEYVSFVENSFCTMTFHGDPYLFLLIINQVIDSYECHSIKYQSENKFKIFNLLDHYYKCKKDPLLTVVSLFQEIWFENSLFDFRQLSSSKVYLIGKAIDITEALKISLIKIQIIFHQIYKHWTVGHCGYKDCSICSDEHNDEIECIIKELNDFFNRQNLVE